MAFMTLDWKFAFAALLVLSMCASHATSRDLYESSMVKKHEQWMNRHGRVYKDDIEKAKRFKIFKDNVEYIEFVNKAETRPYKLGINHFADLTNDEIRASRNGYKMSSHRQSSKTTSFKYENATVPSTIDWRIKGAVTGIKDQGICRSCWAFSAVAATEGINQIKTGKLISLSEQELVDCDKSSSEMGCEGGLMDDAFKFIINNQGLTTESNYPYEGIDGTCIVSKEYAHAAKITGYEDVPTNSESALLKTVANQPVSVAIDSSSKDFHLYSNGVFTGGCGTDLDHGVTAVGYGETSDGTKYWLVKNSWGTGWGEGGYIRMQRDVETEEGLCGIAMQASYPSA